MPFLTRLNAMPAHCLAHPLTPFHGDWTVHDFRFHGGEVLPRLRLHYTTLGPADGTPVLLLHGTAGSGRQMLAPEFADALFGPGQPLDARKHFIVLPDAIGAGGSSKPSDGLRARFPRYNYDDMVLAQYRLLTEHLGLRHLRLVLGNSMGGMHSWLWAQRYPQYMDLVVPMAALPAPLSGRNWLTRRMLIDSIRHDPAWEQGNYRTQPPGLQRASVFFNLATNGGSLALQQAAPDSATADALLAQRLQAPCTLDANDYLYQWEAGRDYDGARELERIQARVLAILSADDERNPPESGLIEAALQRVKNGQLWRIPASRDTCGHATTGHARHWQQPLAQALASTPDQGA